MCHLWCWFQMLSTHLKQKQVFGFRLKGLRLWHNIGGDALYFGFLLFHHRTNIQTTCTHADHRPPTAAMDVTFFIGQAKIQGAKTIPPMPNVFFYEILALSPPCVHHAEVTRGHWLGNLDEAGGGVGLSGIDPQCAHCAERQKDLFQHCTHGNQLWTSLIVA